ncbi:hypothetical protein Baya_13502 [Bagarius yarrelli]|uniref:Uncharacterized protein n=1 Tax=Bagarius yarrelli TaxID=175774 RepID=A0A556V662_BAGYA|nr:hypothetical protein Baya_13502 [Bagarius yarrelli]
MPTPSPDLTPSGKRGALLKRRVHNERTQDPGGRAKKAVMRSVSNTSLSILRPHQALQERLAAVTQAKHKELPIY